MISLRVTCRSMDKILSYYNLLVKQFKKSIFSYRTGHRNLANSQKARQGLDLYLKPPNTMLLLSYCACNTTSYLRTDPDI